MSTEGPNTQFGGDFDDIFSFEPVFESLSKQEYDSDKEELAVEPKKTTEVDTEAATKVKPFISSQPISVLPLPSSYNSYLLNQFRSNKESNEESNEEKKNKDSESFEPHTPVFRKRRVHPQGL